jgi:hypothetical protein
MRRALLVPTSRITYRSSGGFRLFPLLSGNVLDEPGSTYTAASFKLDVSTKGAYDVYGEP